jgi:hypothetical protein
MFGDSRRKLRAWYQAQDPSQEEEGLRGRLKSKDVQRSADPIFVDGSEQSTAFLLD